MTCPLCKQKLEYFMDRVSLRTKETWYMCKKCGPQRIYDRAETQRRIDAAKQKLPHLQK